MRSTLATLALLATSLVMASCDTSGGRTDPPNVGLQVIHAAPSFGPIVFRRVQANATTLNYKQGATFSFDIDTYTFNFDVLAVDGTSAQTISLVATLETGSTYFIVLREVGGQPEPMVIERPALLQGAGTDVEVVHAATTIAAVDVFVDIENFDLSMANARGTVDFDDVLTIDSLAAGDYEFVLTEPGNKTNVLLDSETFPISGVSGLLVIIVDGAGEGLAPLALTIGDQAATTLVDRNLESGFRVINALSDRSAIDAGIDGELMPPLITDVAFGTASDFALFAAGEHNFNVTPAMTPDEVEIDELFDAAAGRFATWLVTGAPGDMSAMLVSDDFRVVPGESKLLVYHGSPANGAADVYVVAPGTDLTTIPPTVTARLDVVTPVARLAPGDYEITVQEFATGAVLAGPIAATVAADGYYGILLTDAAAGTGLEVALLYDF